MNKYIAQEQAYKNGYELGEKVLQEEFAEQFIKGFNEAEYKNNGLVCRGYYLSPEDMNSVIEYINKLQTEIEKYKRLDELTEKSNSVY